MDLDRLVENRHGNGWYRYVRELTWKIQDKTEQKTYKAKRSKRLYG